MSSKIKSKILLCNKCKIAPNPWNDPYECISCGLLYCVKCSNDNFSCVKCFKKSLKTSKLAKRILGNQVINCDYCGLGNILYKNLPDHTKKCSLWEFKCQQAYCTFKGKQNDLLNHIQLDHEKEILTYFHKYSPYNIKKTKYVNTTDTSINISKAEKKLSEKKDGKKEDCSIF